MFFALVAQGKFERARLSDKNEDVQLMAKTGLEQMKLSQEKAIPLCARQLKESTYAEAALRKSGALAVRGEALPGAADGEPKPPVEAYFRVIDQPVLRLVSVDLKASAEQSSDSRKTFALTKTRFLIPGH